MPPSAPRFGSVDRAPMRPSAQHSNLKRSCVARSVVSLPDATDLATQDRFKFECWALGLIGARSTEPKRGADGGIDGRLFFHDEPAGGPTRTALFSVDR